MTDVSFNDIFNAISLTLHSAFPNSEIYGENTEQGVQYGSFNVLPISTATNDLAVGRNEIGITAHVIYYLGENETRANGLSMCQRLSFLLKSISTANGLVLHSKKINSVLDDDVVHCVVDYPCFVFGVNASNEEMQSLSSSVELI